jgi:hypothetical protein
LSKDISKKTSDNIIVDENKKRQAMMFDLKKETQEDIVSKVISDVEKDCADRQEFMSNRLEIIDMYEGKKEPKSDPFPSCANIKTMVLAMTVELLHAKLFPTVYNDELIYWIPQEKADIDTADNVSKFMKWALRSMRFSTLVDDMVKNLILEGTVVTKVRWEEEFRWIQRKRIKKESTIKRMKNVILNMMGVKKTKQVEENDYEIEYDYKKFENCAVEILPLEDVGFPVHSIPGSDETKLRHIWHRTHPFLEDLKDKQDLGWFTNVDGIDSFATEEVMQGTDKSKMDAEGVRASNAKRDNMPLELVEWYGKYNIPGKGRIECIFWVEKKSKTFLGGMPLLNISRINKRPFVIGQLIKRTNRMYGKGIGDFVKELQKEMDAIHNQRLDAGTMSLTPPGVYRAASSMTPEEIQIRPGLWLPLDDVNDAKWLVMPNNVLVSFQEERMLMELIEKIASVGSYQSGQESDINRSRSTARGTLAIISQGEQRFITLAKRIQITLSKVLSNILQQYQEKIPPGLERRILGNDGDPIFPEGIAPEDIAGGYDVFQGLDTTGGSKSAEQQVAAMLYQGMSQNPFITSNPVGFWELTADAFRAAGKVDVERYIGQKPKVARPVSQNVNDENMAMLQGHPAHIKPTDNVMEHLMGHMSFKSSPDGLSMPPENERLLDEHIIATKQQLLQLMNKNASAVPEGAQGDINDNTQGDITGGNDTGVLEGSVAPTVGANVNAGEGTGSGSPVQ